MVSFGTLRVEALDKSRSSWLPDARMETGPDKITISKLVRSRRRTIELTITEDARLVVRAPLRTPLHLIHGVIDKKQEWILRKIREAGSRPALPPREFRDGERFLFLGKAYELKISRHMARPVELGDQLFISSLALPEAQRALEEWYRGNAAKHMRGRCAYYARLIGRSPKLVRISNAAKRWGSCSPKGNLNFSWRLMMAPPEVIDYLVVHEMAHLEVLNHSTSFWDRVALMMPDYRVHKKWLRENGHMLTID